MLDSILAYDPKTTLKLLLLRENVRILLYICNIITNVNTLCYQNFNA